MSVDIVLTVTGPDRVGIVEEVTGILLGLDANVETSRMARLGGEFAMLLLVALPEEQLDGLDAAFDPVVSAGFLVGWRTTTRVDPYPGWTPYRIEVRGADHEGIIYEVASGLASQGVTVESMETGTEPAPVSGSALFWMDARVLAPPHLADQSWIAALDEAAQQAGVDLDVSRESGS